MKNYVKAFLLTLLISIPPAEAITNSCMLLQISIPEIGLSQTEIENYQAKLKSECALTNAFKNLSLELKSKYNISPEQITEYQAMRFVRRIDYENSKAKEIPIELTYQILRSQYQLPNDQKSSIIWDNWLMGIKQLDPWISQLQQGLKFDFQNLKRVHVGFYKLSNEVGDAANIPDEGIIKPPVPNDNYWWEFTNEEELIKAKNTVNKINEHYASLGLLPQFKEPRLNRILDIRLAVKRQPPEKQNVIEYVPVIYSGQTQANPTHLKNLFTFMHALLQQAQQNQHLVWNNKIMTPGEMAYFVQKFYIGVHPFSDGNGRTSRFLQELLLRYFELPHGSSGDLMESDVLTTFGEYYYLAINSNIELIKKLKLCLDLYRASNINNPALDYSCRILKTN